MAEFLRDQALNWIHLTIPGVLVVSLGALVIAAWVAYKVHEADSGSKSFAYVAIAVFAVVVLAGVPSAYAQSHSYCHSLARTWDQDTARYSGTISLALSSDTHLTFAQQGDLNRCLDLGWAHLTRTTKAPHIP